MSAKLIDLTGQRFGRLTVLQQVGNSDSGGALWLCECECGEQRVIESTALRNRKRPACSRYCIEELKRSHNA